MSAAAKKVGMIGAGRMGQPMIGHLARKGFEVMVYDVDAAKRAPVEKLGGRWQADAGALARSCEVILVCVGFDRELRELLSVAGPLRAPARGTISAVLATVHPKTMVELAQSAATRGVVVVDSPVCRGGKAADEGTLLSFVGGDPGVVARLSGVLSAFCADIVNTGAVGTGQVAKAANNW
jgi:3-hydroxyisobutyrate dehydrogenase and related beta-hydroxyacid dehydrogenases